ncbi:MAG TPA: hypothetical protein VJT84_04185, partial [Gaiellaceae bacterium]|nr:hypothetical protein [Gaiellaceae bacterium]
AAPWAAQVGGVAGGQLLRGFLAARVTVRFDDAAAGVDEQQEYEALYELERGFDADSAVAVDYDDRDFVAAPPEGASYVLPGAAIDTQPFFRDAEREISRQLSSERTLELQRNKALKLVSRPGETPEQFAQRCDEAAQAAADQEAAKIKTRLEAKRERLQAALAQAQRRVEELSVDERSRHATELIAGAGAVLGAILGGRRSTRSIAGALGTAASRRGMSARTSQRKESAEERVAEKQDDLQQLEQEILEEVEEIDNRWKDTAAEVETVSIRPDAGDVQIERLALVWVPSQ